MTEYSPFKLLGILKTFCSTEKSLFFDVLLFCNKSALQLRHPWNALNRITGGLEKKNEKWMFLFCRTINTARKIHLPSHDLSTQLNFCTAQMFCFEVTVFWKKNIWDVTYKASYEGLTKQEDKASVIRPISQWQYYGFLFSTFCVFPSVIHRGWAKIKYTGPNI